MSDMPKDRDEGVGDAGAIAEDAKKRLGKVKLIQPEGTWAWCYDVEVSDKEISIGRICFSQALHLRLMNGDTLSRILSKSILCDRGLPPGKLSGWNIKQVGVIPRIFTVPYCLERVVLELV